MPKAAKRYILYHSLVVPTLFVRYIAPYVMLKVGLSIVEVGFLYVVGGLLSAALMPLLGSFLNQREPNDLLALDCIVSGLAYVLLACAFWLFSVPLMVVALALDALSSSVRPAYVVYEYNVYPEEIREKAFVYHNLLPFASQAISYPLLGFLFGVLFPEVHHLIAAMAIIGLLSFLYTFVPLVWLPRVRERVVLSEERKKDENKTSIREFVLTASILLLLIAANNLTPIPVFVNLLVEKFGENLLAVGVYEGIYGLTMVALSASLLRVDKSKGKLLVMFSLLLDLLAYLLLGFGGAVSVIFLAAAFSSASHAMFDPFYMDALFSKVPDEKKGTLLGAMSGAGKAMSILVPFAGAVIAGMLGASSPYVLSAFLVLAAIAIAYSTI